MTKKTFVMRPYLRFSLISIKRIDCKIQERDLNRLELQLDRGAELILEARGVINPLVVKRTNNIYNGNPIDEDTPDGRYELINGFFEYFCAVRAMAIDPSLECVQSWICSEINSKALESQLALFRDDDRWDDGFDLDFALEGGSLNNAIEEISALVEEMNKEANESSAY